MTMVTTSSVYNTNYTPQFSLPLFHYTQPLFPLPLELLYFTLHVSFIPPSLYTNSLLSTLDFLLSSPVLSFPQMHTQTHGLMILGSNQMNIFKLAKMNLILF